jgi:coenzyme F420-reducing hydrogenase beta subunit
MTGIPRVIEQVVNNDLCIGCGICVYECPSNALEMKLNETGFLVANQINDCDSENSCLKVCPFDPIKEEGVKNEDTLAEFFLNDAVNKNDKVGRYNNIYTGYSNEFRKTSSSGGMATFILKELLNRGLVDHVFSVKESKNGETHYEYQVASSDKQLLMSSKTRYYPVTLATVLPELEKLEGKVAIVGVACFLKGIRLLQSEHDILKEKITFLVGIICGGIKSSFFTEYLSNKAGASIGGYSKPEFRVKDINSSALDYSFQCSLKSNNDIRKLKMNSLGDMWGTGLFKSNACDFCDDVTTELADISLGDAWLEPFMKDGKGTNVIVTRSRIADLIIQEGIKTGDLQIEPLSLDKFIASQKGSFNHRQNAISFRLNIKDKMNTPYPFKRHTNIKISLTFKIVQLFRMLTRKKSLQIWKETKNHNLFDMRMKKYLFLLKFSNSINHKYIRLINKFKK